MRLVKKPLINVLNEHLIDYPTPTTINYMWSFGFLSEVAYYTTSDTLDSWLIPLLLLLLVVPAAVGQVAPVGAAVEHTGVLWPAEIIGPTEAAFFEWLANPQSMWGSTLLLSLLAGVFGLGVWTLGYSSVPQFRAQPIVCITGMAVLGLCLLYVRTRFLSHRLHRHEDAYLGKDVYVDPVIDTGLLTDAVSYGMAFVFVLLLLAVLLLSARVLAVEVGLCKPSSSGWLALAVATTFIFTIVLLFPITSVIIEEFLHPGVKLGTISPTGSPAPGPVGSLVESTFESVRGYLRSRFLSPSGEGSAGISNPFVEDGDNTFRHFYNWAADTAINWGVEVIGHSPLGQRIDQGAQTMDNAGHTIARSVLVCISTGIIGVAVYRFGRRG